MFHGLSKRNRPGWPHRPGLLTCAYWTFRLLEVMLR